MPRFGCARTGAELDCPAVRILPWYILRQHLVPFLLGFGVVTFIFEMDVLFDYLDLVINRGVPVLVVEQDVHLEDERDHPESE